MSKTNHADPLKTKTGKTRLGPLSLAQLNDMLEKSSRPKDKSKIVNRIKRLEKILHKSNTRVIVVE
jgi:DNA-binding transcriptional regulator WhiA